MNSLEKSTYPLFESICVLNDEIQNAEFHERRFKKSYQKFFWSKPKFALLDGVLIPKEFQKGTVKLRVSYGAEGTRITFHFYEKKEIKTLKIIHNDTLDYELKFEDRTSLNAGFDQRGACDDILIIKNGLVTDTSYANIIFYDGTTWNTPKTPLLKGTKREKLLHNGHIHEQIIQVTDLKNFKGFQLINAMLQFKNDAFIPIENIFE